MGDLLVEIVLQAAFHAAMMGKLGFEEQVAYFRLRFSRFVEVPRAYCN